MPVMLRDHGIYWFEEALRPEAIYDFVRLRDASRIPIATGETLTLQQTFRPWFAHGAMDIVSPDVTKVGGISEQIQMARMANESGIRYIGHGSNTAVGFAADLQLASAIPTADLVEYIGGSPYLDDIKQGARTLSAEGFVQIPTVPNVGIELDPDALGRFTPERQHLLKP